MMIFRCPGPKEWEGISYDSRLIDGDEIPQGWYETILDAQKAAAHPADINDSGEVTREEMEQKAKELGLKFDGRTSNRKLLTMIEEALK